MATNVNLLGSQLRGHEVTIGRCYMTRIESGPVKARVLSVAPEQSSQRNRLFLCVDAATGQPLPKPKRAADLDPIHPDRAIYRGRW
jgi:hypothetical protein